MKILISTFTFPPNKDGVSLAAWAMAEGFAEAGYEVTICTGFLSDRGDLRPHKNIRVEQFRLETTKNTKRDFPGESARYQNFLVAEQPDYLFCHCWEIWPTALAEAVFPLLRGRKIMVSHGYTTHLWCPNPQPFWGLGVLLRSIPKVFGLPWTMRKYDRVLFLSSAKNFDRFFDHLVASATVYRGARVVPNGTVADPDRGSPDEFRNRFGLRGKFFVLCVANYSERKNQELAVSVFRAAKLGNATLVFIGSEFNDYSTTVERLDKSLRRRFPSGEVLLLEKLERCDTLAGIAACDLFLLTAKAETQPISLLEAMAAGRPFLSTDTGCVRELPGGLIARREAGLVSALRNLFRDPKLREDLGRKGREAVLSTFAQDKVCQAQLQILRELAPKNTLPLRP